MYKHECKLCQSTNGIYIGITCRDPEKRWQNGAGYLAKNLDGSYHQPAIANAIVLYGWENFTHEILLEGLTEAEAKQKEMELIAYYNSYKCGLNCTRGGDGNAKFSTEEERQVCKQQWWANYRETNAAKIYKYQKQYKAKNSEHIAELNRQYRLAHKDETAEYKKQYYLKNKEQINNRVREYRKSNKEAVIEQNRKYYIAHKEELNKKSKQYREQHKAELVEKSRVARAKKLQLLNQLRMLNTAYPHILTADESNSLRTKDTCGGIKHLSTLLAKFQNKYMEVSTV